MYSLYVGSNFLVSGQRWNKISEYTSIFPNIKATGHSNNISNQMQTKFHIIAIFLKVSFHFFWGSLHCHLYSNRLWNCLNHVHLSSNDTLLSQLNDILIALFFNEFSCFVIILNDCWEQTQNHQFLLTCSWYGFL